MTPDVKAAIRRTSLASAVIGAVLSPIPLVDELVLMPVYLGMAARIAKLHDLTGRAVPWRPIAWTTVNGLLARAAANVAVSYIPGVAAVANAASAALLTGLLGDYIDEACDHPEQARPLGVKALVERIRSAVGAPATP
jgi:uncharacterized protein (DUF697 family)